MNTVILICIIVVALFFCLAVVYFVLTMIEIRKLVRDTRISIEDFNKRIGKLNISVDGLKTFAGAFLSGLSVFSKGVFTSLSAFITITKFVIGLLRKKKSKKEGER